MSVLEEGRFVDNSPLNWLLLPKLSPLIGCFQLDWTIQTCRWRELPPGWRPELRASNCWCRKVLDAGTSNKRSNWNRYLHYNILLCYEVSSFSKPTVISSKQILRDFYTKTCCLFQVRQAQTEIVLGSWKFGDIRSEQQSDCRAPI